MRFFHSACKSLESLRRQLGPAQGIGTGLDFRPPELEKIHPVRLDQPGHSDLWIRHSTTILELAQTHFGVEYISLLRLGKTQLGPTSEAPEKSDIPP